MMRVFAGAAVLALLISSAAAAQPQNGTPAPVIRYESVDTPDQMRTGAANENPDQMVCRTITVSGSRLGGHRVCHTRAEWGEIAAHARQQVENVVVGGNRYGRSG